METRNVIAAVSLSAAVILLYSLWFSPSPEEIKQNQVKQEQTRKSSDAPSLDQNQNSTKLTRKDALSENDRIQFENEFIKGSIALTNGGAIDDFSFTQFNKTLNSKEKITLLNPGNVENGYLFNTGWATNFDVETPNSKTVWKVDGNSKLTPTSPVRIYFENSQGIRFERKISLDQKYLFSIDQKIINNSNTSYKFYPYAFLHRNNVPEDLTNFYILHEGFVTLADSKLKEIDYDEIVEKKYSKEANTGYIAIGDKYWMTSLIPNQGRKFRIDIDYNSNIKKYRTSFIDLEGFEVDANSSVEHTVNSIIGAKEIKLINKYAEELNIEKLDLIVNFGVFYMIIKPMHIVLDYLFQLSGNFGYAIILLTLLIRIIFFPINSYAFTSMSKMKVLAPQMNIMKEKYKDDKTQLQKEMMQLYKREGINPMSSCLPILLQIPIFFSLYKLLLLDIAMRHAPFIWYWKDLSAKDTGGEWLFSFLPFSNYIPPFLEIGLLPALMGITMFMTQRLNPMPGGSEAAEMQKKIFTFFPVFIVFILAPFASGLCLYWTFTNILQYIQQAYILKKTTVKTN